LCLKSELPRDYGVPGNAYIQSAGDCAKPGTQPGGWWSSRHLSGVSYPDDGNALCFLVEESSFWFEHRNRCILEALRLFPPSGNIFRHGGGNGCVARAIQETGAGGGPREPGLAGVRNALNRGIRQVVRATLEGRRSVAGDSSGSGIVRCYRAHFGRLCFHWTGINRLVIPGGRVYITVPACPSLWSNEDKLAGHARRYSVPALRRLLENAGYTVEFVTYFFGFLLLPILFQRAIPYRLGFGAKTLAEDSVPIRSRTRQYSYTQDAAGVDPQGIVANRRKLPVRMGGKLPCCGSEGLSLASDCRI